MPTKLHPKIPTTKYRITQIPLYIYLCYYLALVQFQIHYCEMHQLKRKKSLSYLIIGVLYS